MHPAGPRAEAAWRSAYKRGAQRVAGHLQDLPGIPPLGTALDLLQVQHATHNLAITMWLPYFWLTLGSELEHFLGFYGLKVTQIREFGKCKWLRKSALIHSPTKVSQNCGNDREKWV